MASNVDFSMRFPIEVLILNFNGKHHLKRCLESVLKTDYPNFSVVVVDNGSTDGSVEFIKQNFQNVKIISHRKNLGFAAGYNQALKLTNAPYFSLLNNDVEVTPNWLRELVKFATKPHVAAVTGKILFFHQKNRINACGGIMDKYGCSVNRGMGELDNGQYDKTMPVFYAPCGFVLINRKAWEEIGPFDDQFFFYGEDVDFSWRARLMGYEILCVPSSVIFHKWQGSHEKQIYYDERNRLVTLLKNYSLRSLVIIMPRYFAIQLLKTFWIMKNWGTLNALVILKALFWNLLNLSQTWKKRIVIQRKRRISDQEVNKKMVPFEIEFQAWMGRFLTHHPLLKKMIQGQFSNKKKESHPKKTCKAREKNLKAKKL